MYKVSLPWQGPAKITAPLRAKIFLVTKSVTHKLRRLSEVLTEWPNLFNQSKLGYWRFLPNACGGTSRQSAVRLLGEKEQKETLSHFLSRWLYHVFEERFFSSILLWGLLRERSELR